MIQILALYLDFEGAKNVHVLTVLILGFGGDWRFPTWVWHNDLDLDMVSGFDILMIQILTLYLDFEGTKNINVL